MGGQLYNYGEQVGNGQPAHFGDPEIALNSGEQQAAERVAGRIKKHA